MVVLLFLGILIFLLCFFPKDIEGYYSDTNTASANEALKKLASAIKDIKNNFIKIKDSRDKLTTTDVISKLQPILKNNKDSMYSSGIIDKTSAIVNELSKLQSDFDKINEHFKMISDAFGPLMDEQIVKLDNIKELLTHIPDEERPKESEAEPTKPPK